MGGREGPAHQVTIQMHGLLPWMAPQVVRKIHMRLSLSHAASLSKRSLRVPDTRKYKPHSLHLRSQGRDGDVFEGPSIY